MDFLGIHISDRTLGGAAVYLAYCFITGCVQGLLDWLRGDGLWIAEQASADDERRFARDVPEEL